MAMAMAMAASHHLLSVASQYFSLHRSFSASAASLFPPSCVKPLPKLMFPLYSSEDYSHTTSRFVRKVMVSSDLDEGLEMGDEEEPSFSPELKLYVGNLPFSVDSSALADLFERAGNVEMVEVIYDKLTGRSRGFGFVTMSIIDEVGIAAQQFNGYVSFHIHFHKDVVLSRPTNTLPKETSRLNHRVTEFKEFQGRVLRVNSGPAPSKKEISSFGGRSRVGSSSDSTKRVYVGNFAWGVDNLTLETLFSEQGKVEEARVVYDRESGRSKGFGFVTYSSPDDVNKAIGSLDGIDLNGRSIRVSPAESRPRGQY